MSYSYLFHLPTRLPLAPAELSDETSGPFPDREALKRQLGAFFPDLVWRDDAFGSATSDAGWVEPHLFEHEGLYLSLRCSLRADYSAVVQALCDRYGWIAFDELPRLFQPHRPPVAIE